jgi:D-xylose transport system permease protein
MKTSIAPPQTEQAPSPAPSQSGFSLGSLFRQDLGQIPVAAALVLMALYFNVTTNNLFLSARNLDFLTLQSCVVATVGLGAIMVLLLGEIDLSLAVVASLCGSLMTIVSVNDHFPWWLAILTGLVAGFVIGIINGVIVALLRVPSFIVTLAASLGYQGLLLLLLPNATLILTDPTIKAIAASYLPDYLGIGLPVLAVIAYAGYIIFDRVQRQRLGLSVPPIWQTALNIGLVAVIVGVVDSVFENYFGVPLMVALVIGLIALFWVILRFTTFGRHIYAIGGNAEASRRAGIGVNYIRILVFGLASALAAAAGIFQSSRSADADAAVSQTLLLQAIAAAVIGGVSLFGGRGSAWAVVMGALIIAGLENGLDLNGGSDATRFMVEGVVLLLAVIVDALIRRRSAVTGR